MSIRADDALLRVASMPAVSPGLGEDSRVTVAREAVFEALDGLGFQASRPPQLVRAVTGDVVFRVGGIAAKVYPMGHDMTLVSRRLAVLSEAIGDAWLSPAIPGVIDTAYGSVTLWPWCRVVGQATWGQIGGLLRRLQSTEIPNVRALPAWTPLTRVDAQLERYLADPAASSDWATILATARTSLLAEVPQIRSQLGYGLVHGDVHADNTARHNGKLVFIDLDTMAFGPLEYDLVGAALRLERQAISPRSYRAFVRAVGFDVRTWEHLPLIKDICRLGAATFTLGEHASAAHGNPDVAGIVQQWERRLS